MRNENQNVDPQISAILFKGLLERKEQFIHIVQTSKTKEEAAERIEQMNKEWEEKIIDRINAQKFFQKIWDNKQEFIEVMETSKTTEEAHQKLMQLEEERKSGKQEKQ